MDRDTDITPRKAVAKRWHFLIHRDFALLWCGQVVSQVGDFLFNVTLVLWIATRIAQGLSWAPLAVSGILLSAAFPMVVVRPIAGVFVDRWDRRRTMLWMDAIRAVLILLLLLLSGGLTLPFFAGRHLSLFWQLALIYSVVFLANICAQFFYPAIFALTGEIVSEADLPRASGLNLVMTNLALLIGPSLAGPLFFAVGVQLALLINALSFIVSFLTIFFVRVPAALSGGRQVQGNFLRELCEGIRFLAGNRVLLTIMIALSLAMLGIGALIALDVFFVTENLHASASLYGFLSAAFGLGSIIGASIGNLVVKRIGLMRTFWLSMLSVGAIMLVFARQTSFMPGLAVFFLLGIPNATSNVALEPIILLVTPSGFVGRVNSVIITACNMASLLTVAASGYLASSLLRGFHTVLLGISFGPIDTLFLGTGFLVLMGGLYAMMRLRGVTLAGDKLSS